MVGHDAEFLLLLPELPLQLNAVDTLFYCGNQFFNPDRFQHVVIDAKINGVNYEVRIVG